MSFRYMVRKDKKTSTIRLNYSQGRGSENRFRVTTPYSLNNTRNWDSEKQRVKTNSEEGVDRGKRINNDLAKFKAHYIEQIEILKREGTPLTKSIFNLISLSYKGHTIQKDRIESQFNYCDLLQGWIEKAEKGKALQDKGKFKGYPFAPTTIKNYKSIKGHIEAFERKNYSIKPQQVNKKLYNDLLIYARDCGEDYADGNLGAIIKNFKATIQKLEDEYNINFPNYRPKQWSVISPNALKIALNLDEVTKMYNLDLSDYPERYNELRDSYVFNALSCGARIGDYKKFNHTNIKEKDGDTYLEYVQEKTGKFIVALLPPICLGIIKKHNGIPQINTPQDANRKLKEIGKLCEFNDIEYLRDNKGKVIDQKRKWELVTNHTSRRSFCTIAYLNGMDTINIRAISGHGGEKILLEYINVSQQQHALNMKKTEHFRKLTAINTLRTA